MILYELGKVLLPEEARGMARGDDVVLMLKPGGEAVTLYVGHENVDYGGGTCYSVIKRGSWKPGDKTVLQWWHSLSDETKFNKLNGN